MDEARRAELLAYCRIEEPGDAELSVLDGLYAAAVGYLEGAGISPPAQDAPRRAQYDLLVNAMVLDGYDQRGAQTEGGKLADNPAFRRTLVQLKLTEGLDAPAGEGG